MWKHSPIIFLTIAGIGFAVGQSEREKHKAVAFENAIASMELVCADAQSPKSCRRNVDRYHETCFKRTFTPASFGGRSTRATAGRAHLDLPGYQLCVSLGPEGWREHKRRKFAEIAQYLPNHMN
ncbi:MAG: hypothetical protein AAF493_17060 [Pseudomonadota bacterium]